MGRPILDFYLVVNGISIVDCVNPSIKANSAASALSAWPKDLNSQALLPKVMCYKPYTHIFACDRNNCGRVIAAGRHCFIEEL